MNFIDLFIESAPWLLLGLFIAGIMNRLMPVDILQQHMGKDDLPSIIKAAVIGAPLPLCSCGVIPAAIGLRRAGASRSSTVSFLVATPETGVDSITVSYALLGPFMAVIRPIAAIFSAVATGVLVMFTTKDQSTAIAKPPSSCCSSVKQQKQAPCCCASKQAEAETKSCCSTNAVEAEKIESRFSYVVSMLSSSLKFSTGKLLSDITKWLMIGLTLAAAIKTWVPTDFLVQWGDGFLAMLVMALVGIPMYICATASTPIAAGFLAAGVSPGAILVFMLAGPATNISTMGMIKQELGKSVLFAYISSIITISILFGYLTNYLVEKFSFVINKVAANSHNMDESIIYQISAIILALLMLRNITLKFTTKNQEQLSTSH
jgi:hypothetical protein